MLAPVLQKLAYSVNLFPCPDYNIGGLYIKMQKNCDKCGNEKFKDKRNLIYCINPKCETGKFNHKTLKWLKAKKN